MQCMCKVFAKYVSILYTFIEVIIMETVNVTIRLEKNIKKEADNIFSDFGMSLKTAMNIFLRQTIREQKIPFEIKRSLNCLPNEEANSIADKIIDEHIDAFKELAK